MNTFGKVPKDMLALLMITTLGFTVAVYRISRRPDAGLIKDLVEKSETQNENLEEEVDLAALVDLGCITHHTSLRERVPKNQGTIRVKGRFCDLPPASTKLFGAVQILNASTGYKGTIFLHASDNSFVSDYLVLRSGKNLIRLEWTEPKTHFSRIAQAEITED